MQYCKVGMKEMSKKYSWWVNVPGGSPFVIEFERGEDRGALLERAAKMAVKTGAFDRSLSPLKSARANLAGSALGNLDYYFEKADRLESVEAGAGKRFLEQFHITEVR